MNTSETVKFNDSHTAVRSSNRSLVEGGLKPVGVIHTKVIRADGRVEDLGFTTNARVNAGAIAEGNALFVTVPTAVFNYVAYTSTASFAPAAGDTVLSNEITTAGFARLQIIASAPTTPASLGATTAVIYTKTTTATAAITITGIGLLNAVTVGTLYSEAAFASSVTLASGDSLQITYTINT